MSSKMEFDLASWQREIQDHGWEDQVRGQLYVRHSAEVLKHIITWFQKDSRHVVEL